MLRYLMSLVVISMFAGVGTLRAGEVAPDDCPPFGAAICRGQVGSAKPPLIARPCGAHPEHNLAYALRVGHADLDPISGLIYNPGTTGPDFRKWHYTEAPERPRQGASTAELDAWKDAWCLEDCRIVREDPKRKDEPCSPPAKKAAPPQVRPAHPPYIRCFMGSITGGIDYSKYPNCGAPNSGVAVAPVTAPVGPPTQVLSVKCGATSNVITWRLINNRKTNTLLRSVDGGDSVTVASGGLEVNTFTDSDIQAGRTYSYRHRSASSCLSNTVHCPSGATSGGLGCQSIAAGADGGSNRPPSPDRSW